MWLVAFWGLIVYGVAWLLRGRRSDVREEQPREEPEEILKRRLAQGEISIDEYKQLHAALHETPRKPVSAGNGQPATGVK